MFNPVLLRVKIKEITKEITNNSGMSRAAKMYFASLI